MLHIRVRKGASRATGDEKKKFNQILNCLHQGKYKPAYLQKACKHCTSRPIPGYDERDCGRKSKEPELSGIGAHRARVGLVPSVHPSLVVLAQMSVYLRQCPWIERWMLVIGFFCMEISYEKKTPHNGVHTSSFVPRLSLLFVTFFSS